MQFGIGLAHLLVERVDQRMEEGFLLTELIAVPNGASNDPTQDVAAAFVAGRDAVDDEKGARTDVVGDDPQRLGLEVGATGGVGRRLDKPLEQVDLVVRMDVLQNGGQAL
jgi:hypothetical protein